MKKITKKRKINWNFLISLGVLISLIVSIIYAVVRIILLRTDFVQHLEYAKSESDYALMLFQCILGIIAMFLPSFLAKRLKIELPNKIYIFYIIFLYCAIYLGEVRDFYYRIPHWDTILHSFSGAMLGALGFFVVRFLNDSEKVAVKLNPIFVSMFAFCFAVTMGVIWEIYEFSADNLLGFNMQKTLLENGTPLVGKAAVADTMKDLIVDAIGAFVFVIGANFKSFRLKISLKKHKNDEIIEKIVTENKDSVTK